MSRSKSYGAARFLAAVTGGNGTSSVARSKSDTPSKTKKSPGAVRFLKLAKSLMAGKQDE